MKKMKFKLSAFIAIASMVFSGITSSYAQFNKVYDVQGSNDKDQNPQIILKLSNGNSLYYYEKGWSHDSSRKMAIHEIDANGNTITNQEISWPSNIQNILPSNNYRLSCVETNGGKLMISFVGELNSSLNPLGTFVALVDYQNGLVDWCTQVANDNPLTGFLLIKSNNQEEETYILVSNHNPVGMQTSNGNVLVANGRCIYAAEITISGVVNWQRFYPTVVTFPSTNTRYYEEDLMWIPTDITFNSGRNSYDIVGVTEGADNLLFLFSIDGTGNIAQDYYTWDIGHAVKSLPCIAYIPDNNQLAVSYGYSWLGGPKQINNCGGEIENYLGLHIFDANNYTNTLFTSTYFGQTTAFPSTDPNLVDEPVKISYDDENYIIACNVLNAKSNGISCQYRYTAALLFINRTNNLGSPTRYLEYPNTDSKYEYTRLFDMHVEKTGSREIQLIGRTDKESDLVSSFQDANGVWWNVWETGHKIRAIKTNSGGNTCFEYQMATSQHPLSFQEGQNNTVVNRINGYESHEISLSRENIDVVGCELGLSPEGGNQNKSSNNSQKLSSTQFLQIKNGVTVEKEKIGNVDSKLIVSPIPANQSISVLVPNNFKTSAIQIFDLSGKSIADYKVIENSNQLKLDISKLSSGIYYLRIRNITGKFIKE